MHHNKPDIIGNNKESGSSLVIAIFILVVMSLLGAAMIKMLRSSEQSFAYEVLGTRAYAAAQTGAQWQLQQIFPLGMTAQPNKCQLISAIPDISTIEGLGSCSMKITCTHLIHDSIGYYKVTSTGQCEINGEFTARTVEVEAKSVD